jgi:hypothetical protein
MRVPFPFPIAYPYQLIGAGRSDPDRYDRLLGCYEAVVRYLATVQLSDYLAARCPDPDTNRTLLSNLPGKLTLGGWVEITRCLTALQKQGKFPAYVPELAAFYFKRGKSTSFTPEGEIFNTLLCADRNDWAHRQMAWSSETYAEKFRLQKVLLDRVLSALEFLGRYTLYVAYRGRRDTVTEAFVLMGSAEPGPSGQATLATGLNLPLSPRVREHLEYERTAFLADSADLARQLLLYPLSIFANRDGSEDLFLFDRCDVNHEAIRKVQFRGTRIGQKPLEARPGSEHEALVEQFRAWLDTLRGTPAAVPPARAEDLPAHYFAAQREETERHTRAFVGRVSATRALDRFLARHRRGYFVVRGVPGQGKSALAAHLVQSRNLPHHFVRRTGGRSDPRLILRSLLAQLLSETGGTLPEAVPELTKCLEETLARSASRGQRLVLVFDALDELTAEAGPDLPFLVTEGLPDGVHVVVTSRAGDRLDRLLGVLFAVPHEVHDLTALTLAEMAEILRGHRPELADGEVERIAEAAQGNPLYLKAVADELERNPSFDLRELPAGIDGFFRRATADLGQQANPMLRQVLGLLSAARKPLSLRELAALTGSRQREVHEQGVRPVRPFLLEADGGYCFYHARFQDFVTRELLYEDELGDYHRLLAGWLGRPECRACDYRWQSLSHHLYWAGDRAGLQQTITPAFLADKVRRFGYSVLEDVELLARALLEAGEATLVPDCVALVEGLRGVLGGDLVEEARQAVQGYRAGPAAFRSRVITPAVPVVQGLEVYVGMLPKVEVGADFVEMVPQGERLILAVGDVPGTGLKSAFVARFIGNLFRRLVEQTDAPRLAEMLDELNRVLSVHDYFEAVAMQCAAVDPKDGLLILANAGGPYPVLYSAQRGRSDRLPVRGEMVRSPLYEPGTAPRYEQRRAELGPGDVLVLLTDGLIESHVLKGDGFGYRFQALVEQHASRGARAIGEAILDAWRAHPRSSDNADDVTVVVVAVTPQPDES